MFGKHFELDEKSMSIVEDIGKYMPGGFFIYKAEGKEELLYANHAVFDIYGCDGLEDFKELTGYTFKGMVHPDDYVAISQSINEQIEDSDENIDHVVYRITRKDGEVRWVDDYGHYAESEGMGGLYYVFISDITEKHMEEEQAQVTMEATKRENLRLMDQMESVAGLADLMGSVASLLSNMPAMSFSKEVSTGRYLACNQVFAEFAGKNSPDEVVGHTDHELFDKNTADHFVEDDAKAVAMDEPYIFFEDVPDASGKLLRKLQTTKLKFTDSTGRLCTLGLCVDVTEISRIKESEARQQEMEERIALQDRLLEEQKQRKRQSR